MRDGGCSRNTESEAVDDHDDNEAAAAFATLLIQVDGKDEGEAAVR